MSFSPLNHSLSVYRMNACQSFRKRSSISCPGDIAKSLEERWKAYCTVMSSTVQLKCTKACYPLAVTLALVCICSRDLATHELFQVLRTAAEESILYNFCTDPSTSRDNFIMVCQRAVTEVSNARERTAVRYMEKRLQY